MTKFVQTKCEKNDVLEYTYYEYENDTFIVSYCISTYFATKSSKENTIIRATLKNNPNIQIDFVYNDNDISFEIKGNDICPIYGHRQLERVTKELTTINNNIKVLKNFVENLFKKESLS